MNKAIYHPKQKNWKIKISEYITQINHSNEEKNKKKKKKKKMKKKKSKKKKNKKKKN